MESGLFGLQPEASSYLTCCLILRASKPQLMAIRTISNAQIYDFGPLGALTEHVSSQNLANVPALFNQCCLSDSLLDNNILLDIEESSKKQIKELESSKLQFYMTFRIAFKYFAN